MLSLSRRVAQCIHSFFCFLFFVFLYFSLHFILFKVNKILFQICFFKIFGPRFIIKNIHYGTIKNNMIFITKNVVEIIMLLKIICKKINLKRGIYRSIWILILFKSNRYKRFLKVKIKRDQLHAKIKPNRTIEKRIASISNQDLNFII